MDIKTAQKYLAIIALTVAVGWVLILDYNDLSWKTNKIAYFAIGTMLLLAVSGYIKYKNSEN